MSFYDSPSFAVFLLLSVSSFLCIKRNNNTLLVICLTVISSQSPGDLQSFWEKNEPCTNLSYFSDSMLECFKIDTIGSNRMSSVLHVQTLHLQNIIWMP